MILIWLAMVCVSLLYAGLIIAFQVGLNSLQATVPPDDGPPLKVSVIVPFRNEESHIQSLVSSLAAQEYPREDHELLFIDDHSEDRSRAILEEAIKTMANARILELAAGSGKKAALAEAVRQARHGHIIITDADCQPGTRWLARMGGFFKQTSPGMLIGPVLYRHTQEVTGRMQSLEYLSLTGITAGSAGLGSPIMASGANLMFKRETFLEFLEEADPRAGSGEDVFFVLWLKKQSPGTISYLLSHEAAVWTQPSRSFRDFAAQRMRWASKSRYYRDVFLIFTSLTVYLFNLVLLLVLAGGIFTGGLLKGFFLMFAAKCIVDVIFLTDVCTKFRQGNLLKVFLPVQVLYPLYIVIAGTSGLMLPYIWKGRRKGTAQGHG